MPLKKGKDVDKEDLSHLLMKTQTLYVLEDKRYNYTVISTFLISFHALIISDHVHFTYIMCLDPIFGLGEPVSFQSCNCSKGYAKDARSD